MLAFTDAVRAYPTTNRFVKLWCRRNIPMRPLVHVTFPFVISLTTLSLGLLALGGCGGGGGGGSAPGGPGLAAARVAFQTNRDGNQEIYVMNGDGTGPVRLTNNASDDLQPAFNRNGSLIAFVSKREEDQTREIYVMNADGSQQRAVTQNSFEDGQPSFSPLSDTIVFQSSRNNQTDIYSFDLKTGVEKQLTNDLAFEDDPTFLADGRILFSSNPEGVFRLYTLNTLTNGTPQPLPRVGEESQFFSNVSRDGRITFVSNLDGDFEIYVMDADGQNRRRLTNNAVSDVDPDFSADGSRIYYASLIDGNFNIFVTNADGSGMPRRITSQPSIERLPNVH